MISGDVDEIAQASRALQPFDLVQKYVIAIYNENPWVGLVEDVNEEYGDYRINFMHPKGPATQLYWPDPVDKCWVEEENIICTINAPLMALSRQIRYKLTPEYHAKVAKVSAKWSGMM